MSKIWIKLEVEVSEVELWVEHGEDLYASYYGEKCIDIDYDAAWDEYRERQYEAK